jgi:hypothetical protein
LPENAFCEGRWLIEFSLLKARLSVEPNPTQVGKAAEGGTPEPNAVIEGGVGETGKAAEGDLTGLYSAISNPVLERLGYGMANIRLISRDAAERNASRPTGR